MSTEQNPYEAPKTVEAPDKPEKEDNPYWGRTSILDWYGSLGIRGRLRWIAGIFLAANGVTYLFGFYFPKMLIGAVIALGVSFLLPASMDD